MNSIEVCLPASVTLSAVAEVIGSTLPIQAVSDPDGEQFAQVNVLGTSPVIVGLLNPWEFDPDGDWSRQVRRLLGDFSGYDFASSDFARVCAAIEPVVGRWPAILDGGLGHLVSGESFLAWLSRHRQPSWTDVYDYTSIGRGDRPTWGEMPVLATYEIEQRTIALDGSPMIILDNWSPATRARPYRQEAAGLGSRGRRHAHARAEPLHRSYASQWDHLARRRHRSTCHGQPTHGAAGTRP